MALPEIDFCTQLEIDIDLLANLKITLPGGAELSAMLKGFPDPQKLTAELMAQVNSALTPLVPIFNIIDIALAVFECIKAIPDSLGPPPDPTKLGQCISKLTKVIDIILGLIPQVSVGIFVKDIISVILVFLLGLRAELLAIIKAQVKIDLSAAKATALGLVELQVAVDCAQVNLDLQMSVAENSAKPLSRLIGLLNIFLGLIGQDPIGPVTIGADASAALAPLDVTIELLTTIRDSLPVP